MAPSRCGTSVTRSLRVCPVPSREDTCGSVSRPCPHTADIKGPSAQLGSQPTGGGRQMPRSGTEATRSLADWRLTEARLGLDGQIGYCRPESKQYTSSLPGICQHRSVDLVNKGGCAVTGAPGSTVLQTLKYVLL